MTKKTVFLFNGPPRCGKSTLAQHLFKRLSPAESNFVFVEKFARPLDDIARALTGLGENDFIEYRESRKDEPLPSETGCGGLSLRQLYILASEQWIKPSLSADWFGRMAAHRVKAQFIQAGDKHSVCIIDDCGFQTELDAFVRELKRDDSAIEIYVVRLKRVGCDFSGDSREYVKHSPTLREHDIGIGELVNDAASPLIFTGLGMDALSRVDFYQLAPTGDDDE